MTNVTRHKVTCSDCGNNFPALVMLSTNNFIKQTPEQEAKSREAWEKNGECPECGTKNEVTYDLPTWKAEDEVAAQQS